ncbi:OmpA family protein [Mucilaginibacter sp. X4EP1]|uniref:OmpA family protein n=1 Tax=Mucilaginibacter sp. X4EP1 TaxID=2723092 RepID=UPI00216A934F|nr:OmpA family protein [Mucilaginibacter sp. X4EP1]MCS3814567.1 outer membrane protein OmpA-like peptidoglycan-associated protein/tetratricopeptide (TPR) repeat protein [Mucilaginibacter sp. X4EP1]
MRVTTCSILLIFLSVFVNAQQKQYTTNSKAAIKYFVEANHALDDNMYDEAIDELKQAVDEDSKFIEAHLLLADIYHSKRLFQPATEQYLKVVALNPEFNQSVYLKAGEDEVNQAHYDNALKLLQKYLSYPALAAKSSQLAQLLAADCSFSLNAMEHPVPFLPVNMGPAINTADDEYLPVTTADETTLIFTRKINNNEDFYKSIKVDGKWQTATYLSDRINTPEYNEGAQSLSQDGKFLFFTGCNRPDGLGRCDIYVAQKKGDDWGKPFDLSPPVNTPGWEAQPSISADGRTLYFVSNRAGGYGGYDIWKSTLTDKGWGEPENLGPNINTPYNEQSPFIHADDSTLYFCSNGWPGLGGMDLFVSRMGKDGKWQKPENLGYPINSNGDESGLTISANGKDAFFSSNNLNSTGGYDIYTFELPANLKPKPVTYVKGKVSDAKTLQPLEAAVEIINLQKNTPVYQDYSDPQLGDFLATLVVGNDYGLNISKTGYLFYSQHFSLVGHEPADPFNITVLLQPIEIGDKVILNNVFFDTNKFNLKDESVAELQKLVEFLGLNPTLHIEISGHTDNVGNDAANQTLSENRAKAVYQYLVTNKVDPTRLTYKGYGKTQPIAPNTTDDGRQKNRRTEVKIVAK